MVGIGYDIHRLVRNRRLFLGGIAIDFDKGLAGHSDGDVVIHAVCDALLGAAKLPDIGHYFPPGDKRCKGIPSNNILKSVRTMLAKKGFRVSNVDIVVIAEAPKISSLRDKMRKNIAAVLNTSQSIISIKGKTNEGLDAVGKGRAIAAWAICEIGKSDAASKR